MSEQHATLLKKARERLVEDRRAFAKIIAAPFEREKTVDPRARQLSCRRRSRPSIAPLTTKRVVKGPSKLANYSFPEVDRLHHRYERRAA